MTPEDKQAKLKNIIPYCLIVGFIGDKLDACVCVSENDFEKEKKKFSVLVKYKLVKDAD